MQQQQAEQGMTDDQAMRSAYSTSGGDQGKYRNALVNAGNYKAVQALDATALTNRKTNADIGKTGVETSKLEQEVVSKALDNAKPFAAQIQDASGAEAYVRGLYNDPVLGKYAAAMLPMEQALQQIPQDPAQLQRWKAGHMQIDGAKLIEMTAPKMQTMNAGDRHVTQGIDQFTGQVMPGTERSTPILQSADNAASQAQSNTNNQRSVAASRDNAAAQRDIAGAQREATMAYQNEQRALQLDKLRFEKSERDQTKETALSTVEDSLGVLDKAIKHPGRETATGISSITNPANIIPGTDARNFRVILDQIKGKAFLQAFQSLKGGGQITEVEGNKATAAIARLDTAQSDEEFKIALEELQAVMQKGYERLGGKPNAGQPAATQKPAAPTKAKSGASVSNW
jgi:hypothetical protein